jgi:hypothetical protein
MKHDDDIFIYSDGIVALDLVIKSKAPWPFCLRVQTYNISNKKLVQLPM